MSKFIKQLLLFLCPVLIGMISLEVLLRKIPNDYSYKCTYLDSGSNNIEVLFLGNSHIYYGINPEYMHYNSFNASHISQSLNYDLFILDKYRNSWKKLKYIIIPIDYFSLYTTLEYSIENWREKNYTIYYGDHDDAGYWTTLEVFNSKLPRNLKRAKTYYFKHKSDITCTKLGFGLKYNSRRSKDLGKTGPASAKVHTVDKVNDHIFHDNIKSLQSIIDFSRRHHFKIIFVTCPAYYTYRDHLSNNQLYATINTVTKLSADNPNTHYFNFISDSSFTAADFYDGDHLNEIGAKKFTLKMDSIVTVIEKADHVQ